MTGLGYDGKLWKLTDQKTHQEKGPGDSVAARVDSIPVMCILVGGTAPHNSASTGRVYIERNEEMITTEYYPAVFELTWIHAN